MVEPMQQSYHEIHRAISDKARRQNDLKQLGMQVHVAPLEFASLRDANRA